MSKKLKLKSVKNKISNQVSDEVQVDRYDLRWEKAIS